MKNLYIDFDGVILDTIPLMYQKINEAGITDKEKYSDFIGSMDWKNFIKECDILNDSIEDIKKIRASQKFNIAILTHVNSLKEAEEKILWIEKHLNNITVIPVPKAISKTKMVHVEDAILVDDFLDNVEDWTNKGGIGVKYSTTGQKKGYPLVTKLDQLLKMF